MKVRICHTVFLDPDLYVGPHDCILIPEILDWFNDHPGIINVFDKKGCKFINPNELTFSKFILNVCYFDIKNKDDAMVFKLTYG